ncbi:MAG TPA: ABC transporter ATP-binding protein [Phototrophicaceae bacterium]|nr:ABC transporter ATP-binding protein [Phototrophicaceae bacterium]
MPESVLQIQDLSVSYTSRRGVARAVRHLSLDIHQGETYGLVGESGCGKSTVALSIMRYLPRGAQMTGKLLFQGQDMMQAPPDVLRHLRGNRIAMVYQDPQAALNPVLTIERQLAEALQAHEDISAKAAYRRAAEMLEHVRMPDPEYTLKRFPHQLSGGMQQRVVIAMALLMHPDLVVMDEPTTGLDVTVEAGVLDLLNDLRREFNMAILYISHNLGVIARICDRVGVMYAGELVEQAAKDELFSRPHHPYTVGLLRCLPQKGARYTERTLYSIPGRVPPLTRLSPGCIFASRCALADAACRTTAPPLETVAPDHVARCIRWQTVIEQPALAAMTPPPPPHVSSEAKRQKLLDVRTLKIYFQQARGLLGGHRDVKAVDGVSFAVQSQQTISIVGESGCGKSTIARGLAGLTNITAGDVDFAGSDFTRPLERRTRDGLRELQMIFQNPDSSLNPRHTIRESLTRPLRLFHIVAPEKEEETLIALLRSVNLDESYLDRYPRHLSGGEKQRVAIARAFAGGPQLVVCDEPISALDVSVQAAVLNLLQRLQSERQVALVFISHDLNAVRYLSDTVAVVYLGKVAEIGKTEAIFNPPSHPYTEALISAIPDVNLDAQTTPIRLSGSVPSPANPPSGCRFHTRCPRKIGSICETQEPPARAAGDGHTIYCHIPLDELTALQTEARKT